MAGVWDDAYVRLAVRHQLVAEVLPEAKWLQAIRRAPSVSAIVELLNLSTMIQNVELAPHLQLAPDCGR